MGKQPLYPSHRGQARQSEERGRGERLGDVERACRHYNICTEEYYNHPELYPLPERGAGLRDPRMPLLTRTERQSLQTARHQFMDIYTRLLCIAKDHPEYAVLREKANQLLTAMESVRLNEGIPWKR